MKTFGSPGEWEGPKLLMDVLEPRNRIGHICLHEHLRELRDRWRDGDTKVVDEFLAFYVFSDQK